MLAAAIASWVINIAGEFVDEIFAGIFLSDTAVSAISLYLPIDSLFGLAACLTSFGMAVQFSKAKGIFDEEDASKIAGQSMLLGLIEGVILVVLMLVFEDAFFSFYSVSPEIESLARQYYIYSIPSAFIYPIYISLYYLVNNDGDAKMCMYADGAFCICNAALSLLLLKPFGIAGLSIGTGASFFISFAVLFLHFLKKNNGIHFKLSFRVRVFKSGLLVSSTFVLMYVYLAVVDMVMNKFVISSFGDNYLPCYAIINMIISFSLLFVSPGTAAAPFLAMYNGEVNAEGLLRTRKLTDRTTFVIIVIFTAFLLVGSSYFPILHGITDPELAALGTYSARVLVLSMPALGYILNLTTCLTLTEKTSPAILSRFINDLAAPLLFATILGKAFGYKAFVWGFFITPYITALILYVYITAKYGKHSFPYILPKSDKVVFIHEFALNESECEKLAEDLSKDLQSCVIDDNKRIDIINTAKSALNIIYEKNKGRKILAYCCVMAENDSLRLILWDNGKIFDLSACDGMGNATSLVAASFNASSFVFVVK